MLFFKKPYLEPDTHGRANDPLANEEGSVIILALIMLMLLTMMGTSATNTSTLEIQVAGNERNYKRNFFKTEAAALQGAQLVQNASSHTETWIKDDTFLHTDASRSTKFDDYTDNTKWEPLSGEGANTYTLVAYTGIAPWSSLDMTSPTQVRAFAVYGRLEDTTKNESMIIETGFAKRM